MNEQSSRSHAIFCLVVERTATADDGGEVRIRAKFNLVDLAGSEKWDVRQEMGDARVSRPSGFGSSFDESRRRRDCREESSEGRGRVRVAKKRRGSR